MIFYHPPHNLEVLRTWELRLGHYMFFDRDDRAGEGRVGVLMDGRFIPFPELERSSSLFPATGTGREFNQALVDVPPRNPETVFEQDDTRAPAGTDFGGALSTRVCGTSPVVVAEVDVERDDEKVASSSRAKSCEDATPNRHHATRAVTHDRIHVNALLSYLASHQRILEIADDWGIAPARGGDIRRGSIVVITQVNTVEVERIEGILRQPISDRVRIAHELFKETSKDRFHVARIPSRAHEDADRARANCASEITLRGEARPVFRSPCACPDDDVDDTKPAPAQVSRPALGENVMVPSTSRSGPPVSKMMFIHYARAMERPDPSIWRRGVDAARFVGEIMTYTFEEDYFPLDELLKHMLAVSCADVAVASTIQLLEIFEDEDAMPAEAEDLRRTLRKIKPTVIVEKHYDSSGRRRRIALLSRSPIASDTASTVSDEVLYRMDLASKSEKWDDRRGRRCFAYV